MLAATVAIGVTTLWAGPVKMGALQRGTALVDEPGAPGGRCVAIRIGEKPGGAALEFEWPDAAPGLYRVSLPLRFHFRPGFNPGSLKMDVAFGPTNDVWLSYPLSLSQLNGAPDTWTVRTQPVMLLNPAVKQHLEVTWEFVSHKRGGKEKPAFEIAKPEVFDSAPAARGPDLMDEISAGAATPLAQIAYPALLVGTPVFTAVATSCVVTKVWPEKVHIYPGETNPVEVTVRNLSERDADAVVRLDMKTGLDETAPVGEQRIRVPGRGTAKADFPWVAGTREYGHAAVATVSVDGKPVHSNAEYFSVSTPIWKTAIQGSGFISWYGRESDFESHVEGNRNAYVNVEEAFSWQPSSWSDLNPTNETWWAGQNQFHNSMAGLREWMARSHSNGIKMITYSWPTISGKSGFDWGRRFPDLLCRERSGVAPKIDLDDLALYDIVHERPELWGYRSANWLNNWINLGLLSSMDYHAREVIRSSRNFGWDGLRFDSPPAWSPMGTEGVHHEFKKLGVENEMKQLMPEYYDMTNDVWSGEAISTRNVRYFRYVMKKELGPNFALAYNTVGNEEVETNKTWWYREMAAGGGQLMNEAIRTVPSLSNYMNIAWWTAEKARTAGGYSCVFAAEACPAPLAGVYSAVFTFASGTHPYLNYGGSMPGQYNRFMTRYGEYCWDPALAPAGPDHAGVTVQSKTPLLWERYVRQRQAGGWAQTVVHLITTPEWVAGKGPAQTQVEWPQDVRVSKPCRVAPEVWRLTAEPELTAERLTPANQDGVYSVTVPQVRFWTMLVWSEKL